MSKNKKGLLRLSVFSLILLFLILPFVMCGELLRAKNVAKLQDYMGDDFIYGSAYSNNYSHYKYQVLTRRNAEVLAIGDSRVLQIKGDFFKNKNDFYNAGMLTVTLDSNINALKNFPKESLPKVLILCMDQSFFTKGGMESQRYFDTPSFLIDEDYHSFNMLATKLLEDRRNNKFTFKEIMSQPARIGVLAKKKGFGFKQDGSYYYEEVYNSNKTAKERVSVDLEKIRKGESWFSGGSHVYDLTVKSTQVLIDFCKENGIYLVAYAPPFSESAIKVYKSRKDIGFLKEIDSVIGEKIRSAGFEFYDYTDPAKLSMNDEYFIDAFHGSDVAYCLMMIDMLESGSILNDYMDFSVLKNMYENRVSDLVLQKNL